MVAPIQNAPQRALTVRQAADLLGIGSRTLWRMLSTGELRSVRIGQRARRIMEQDLAAYQQKLLAAAGN
jgi:excisionase family DNA binding protein